MLVVKLELWPGGLGVGIKTLGTGVIVNDGTGTPEVASYGVVFAQGEYDPLDVTGDALPCGRVENHLRGRDSVWELVRKALNVAFDQGGGDPG